ncbi:MAG: hypothetical protein Q9168_007793, partial [Polycauliona sp. 1 TL-2023]
MATRTMDKLTDLADLVAARSQRKSKRTSFEVHPPLLSKKLCSIRADMTAGQPMGPDLDYLIMAATVMADSMHKVTTSLLNVEWAVPLAMFTVFSEVIAASSLQLVASFEEEALFSLADSSTKLHNSNTLLGFKANEHWGRSVVFLEMRDDRAAHSLLDKLLEVNPKLREDGVLNHIT